MKIFLALALSILILLTSCNKETVVKKPTETVIKTVTFEELFSNKFEAPKGKVIVEGLCVHVCKHSGKKIFIIGTDPNNKLQIFAGDGLAGFPLEIEGSKVRVIGVLEEEKLDMTYADKMESELLEQEKAESKSAKKSCVFEDELKQIKDLKTKISQSPKGYFSLYSMTSTEYKKF